jgi:ribose transport system ATP-binding protein
VTTLQLDGGSAGERQNATARLRVQGLTRTYGATRALDDFSADLLPGEVVALVGHNGAGKSTLAKLLAGLDRPSAGSIELDGHPVTLGSAKDANGHGVSLVPQRLAIVPTLTVRHNITLGLTKAPDVAPTAERLGLTALLDVHVGRLSPAAQRLVMIGRALLRRPTLMIFDEPTAAFSQREVERLFGIIRGLSADGITVLYVSHRLQEVLDIATRVLGMSQGRLISDSPTSGMSRDQLADIIAGTSTTLDQEAHLEAVGVPDALKSVAAGATALSIAGLTTPRKLRGVDLQVRRGEVLGLTGLIGAGRSSLLNTLWGTGEQPDGGSIEVGGSSFEPRSPRAAIRRGIVYVPEDRQRTSLRTWRWRACGRGAGGAARSSTPAGSASRSAGCSKSWTPSPRTRPA